MGKDKVKIVWKVVRQVRERYYSCIVRVPEGGIRYIPGEFVSAAYGPCFAFGSLRSARVFVWRREGGQIWKAEATKVRCAGPKIRLLTSLSLSEFCSFWKAGLSRARERFSSGIGWRVPCGTVLCASVKLIERVDN